LFTFECASPPSRLEEIWLDAFRVETLSGVDKLTHLRDLRVLPRRTPKPRPLIDLSPLLACRSLEWLAIGSNGILDNFDVLDELPHLKTVAVDPGGTRPAPGRRPWLVL
jgi:hypothetical protein